jgi:hypothetical protein
MESFSLQPKIPKACRAQAEMLQETPLETS